VKHRYTLRPASDADEQWLDRLRRAAYLDLFNATWGGWDEAKHNLHFTESLARGHIRVIEIDGSPVGMIQELELPDSVEVAEIQVLPGFQNRGIGRQVLQDTINRALTTDRYVVLSLGLRNHGALRLYERLGFRELQRSETHIHMATTLPD
jgi:ribosomal protein S18 acetylase RimI-like enzyme